MIPQAHGPRTIKLYASPPMADVNTTPPVRVGMIGLGTVGGGVATLLREQGGLYARRTGRAIELATVLVRDTEKAAASGLAEHCQITADPDSFFAAEPDVVVEVAGGLGVGEHVRRALKAGLHVVTANKALIAAEGPELFALARTHGGAVAFEASCAGAIPCITALMQGLMANEVRGLFGILNGTCNFILTEMTKTGAAYAEVLAEAQRRGYAEADPTLDVSGRDAADKLAILSSLAFGVRMSSDDVTCSGIDGLDLADIRYGREMGYELKLLAIAEQWAGQDWVAAEVAPCYVPVEEPLAKVDGAFNALSVYGHAAGHTLYYGAGAGRMPTASAVVSDLLNLVGGGYAQHFAQTRLTPDCHAPAMLVEPTDIESRYYLRLRARDVPGVMAHVTKALGDRGISLSAVLQHEAEPGQFVPVVILTHTARRGDLDQAVRDIEALDTIDGAAVVIRIVDLPEGV